MGYLPKTSQFEYYNECYKLFEDTNIDVIHRSVLEQLKKRINSVGSFELKKDIKVVDLSYMENFSPFSNGYDLTWVAVNIEHLKKIGREIAKPLRRQDSILDYLPTQYISDFINHLGYDGIKYKSTLTPNENNFNCNKVEVYHINKLKYCTEKNKRSLI